MARNDARKYEYYKYKHANRTIVNEMLENLLIPHLSPLSVREVVMHPTSDEELNFAFEYVNLCKMIQLNKYIITDSNLVKPLDNLFYTYLKSVIDIRLQSYINSHNTADKYFEGINLRGLDIFIDINSKMTELGLDDEENYYKVCAESNLTYMYFLGQVIDKSISIFFKNVNDIDKYINQKNRTSIFLEIVNAEVVLFNKDRLIVDDCDTKLRNLNEGTLYLKSFERYIQSLQNVREKNKTDNA